MELKNLEKRHLKMKHLRIDSQILTSISHCPRRCGFTFKERLIDKVENPNFAKGSTVHVGLESYYNAIKEEIEFAKRHSDAIVAANVYAVTKTQLNEADIESCMKTLDEYMRYRREDRIYVIAVEVPFTKILYVGPDHKGEDITIYGEGKIDLVAEEETKIVMDHKTTSRNQLPVDLRNQFMFYHWATNLPVVLNRVGFQVSLPNSERFKRYTFKYEEKLIKEWKSYAVEKALDYAFYLEENEFPPNFSACEGNFGHPCQYINICKYPTLVEETKEFEFKVGEVWDVYSERNT